jgi:hypothetical protein
LHCSSAFPSDSHGVTVAAQWFDPLIQHLAVMEPLRRQSASELNDALIQQPTEPLHDRLLLPVKAVGADKQPIDF